jgi:hypothetical protein
MVHTLQAVRESKVSEEEENPEEGDKAGDADKENDESPVKECLIRANTLHS